MGLRPTRTNEKLKDDVILTLSRAKRKDLLFSCPLEALHAASGPRPAQAVLLAANCKLQTVNFPFES
jgi:hypothetical protein